MGFLKMSTEERFIDGDRDELSCFQKRCVFVLVDEWAEVQEF